MQETIREELNSSRYEKGLELYKEGKVFVSGSGFKVNGYQVDIEKMTCDCPDHRTRKETCKHLFGAMAFVKNRGKAKIEHINNHSNGSNSNGANSDSESKHTPNKPQEAHSKDFDKQATITRLAVINSAIELLKTHRKPIEIQEVISLASQLEKWALSK